MSVLSQLLMARSLMPVILGAKALTSKMLLFHIGFYSRLRPPPVAAISLKRIIPLLAQSEVTRSHELADLFSWHLFSSSQHAAVWFRCYVYVRS